MFKPTERDLLEAVVGCNLARFLFEAPLVNRIKPEMEFTPNTIPLRPSLGKGHLWIRTD